MLDRKRIPLIGRDGLLGWVNMEEQPAEQQEVVVRLENGMGVRIPAELLVSQPDGTFSVPISSEQLRSASQSSNANETVLVIPVIAEELEITKRQATEGRVHISKQVREKEEVIDVPILHQEVQIERQPVNRFVASPPDIRYEGNTMIIPVLEEVLVVEKRLRVKEEVRVTRIQKEIHEPKQFTLREESVDVKRMESKQNKRKEP